MLKELHFTRTYYTMKVMRSSFITSLLLCTTTCWAGDPCPLKGVLKICSCTQVSLDGPASAISFRRNTNSSRENITTHLNNTHDTFEMTPMEEEVPANVNNIFTTVQCHQPQFITDLEEIAMVALHRKLVDKLVVSHIPPAQEELLARLPNGWLRNTRIKQLELLDSVLSGDFIWFNNPFEGQSQSLMRISVKRCNLFGLLTQEDIGTVNTKGLMQLTDLQEVDFSYNRLTVIKATAFRNPPANLSTIKLDHNAIQVIDVGSFQYVPLLACIDLAHNLLKKVVRTIFASPAKLLESIDFSWNFLTELPLDFFTNMPALKIVNLSKNFLHSLPERPWGIIFKKLTFVDVSDNFINCDCNLVWLQKILYPNTSANATTPSPISLPGQTVKGSCILSYSMPEFYTTKQQLVTMPKEILKC